MALNLPIYSASFLEQSALARGKGVRTRLELAFYGNVKNKEFV